MRNLGQALLDLAKARLVKLVLAATVALPVTAGLAISNAAPVSASVCYYGPWTYDTISFSPTYGASFFSEVKYQIGYSCAGYADSTYIAWFYDSATFTHSVSYTYHETTQGDVCDYFVASTHYCHLAWGPDYTIYKCLANCTVYRVDYPARWFNYDPTALVFSHWAGINTTGSLNFSDYHQFLTHKYFWDTCC